MPEDECDKKAIFRCHKGSTIIEFAVAGPVLLLFMVGFLELGLIFMTSAILEGTMGLSSRIGKTGFAPDNVSREDFIRSEAQRLSGGFISGDSLNVEIISYRSFESIGQPEPCSNPNDAPPCSEGFFDINENGRWDNDQGARNAGRNDDAVLYQISYNWRIFTPLMRFIIGDGTGFYRVKAVSVTKNERFIPES